MWLCQSITAPRYSRLKALLKGSAGTWGFNCTLGILFSARPGIIYKNRKQKKQGERKNIKGLLNFHAAFEQAAFWIGSQPGASGRRAGGRRCREPSPSCTAMTGARGPNPASPTGTRCTVAKQMRLKLGLESPHALLQSSSWGKGSVLSAALWMGGKGVAFGCLQWQERVASSCEGSAPGQAGLPPAHFSLALLADDSSAVIGKGSSFFLEEPWKDASEHNLCDCWRNRSGEELAAQY